VPRSVAVLICFGLWACPQVNSQPCAEDAECPAAQRCRRGACGPICLNDGECGDGQVCRAGTCQVRPECAQDTDCASGFTCGEGLCRCSSDQVCAANQACVQGRCSARTRCTLDTQCSGGTRCEVTQGLCVPSCRLPQDCAPNLDANVATALYACSMGTCTRRCTADLQCGGEGRVCRDTLCASADCKTKSDCAEGQYCTSATFGRCEAFSTCTSSATCDPNFRCEKFSQMACPPGFDCATSICRELPRCFIDADCVSGVPGTPQAMQNGFCASGHCQATDRCLTTTSCTQGRVCIGGLCVPSVCRGHPDCGANKACVDGVCLEAPQPADVARISLTPTEALLEVGDTLRFRVIVYRLDGSSFPLERAAFSVLDTGGQPGAAGTITPEGVLTAVSAGQVIVRASVPGAFVAPLEARVRLYPRVTTGRRVLVVDAANRRPLEGVVVWACEGATCPLPTEAVTDATGVALFPTVGAQPLTFTAVSPAVRADALPAFERVSVLATRATDLYLPLRDNPVKAHAGFNGAINFSQVSASGTYWLGLIASAIVDLPSMKLTSLVGDPVQTEVPTINQRVPVPGAIVLYTSPAFGIPNEVKGRSLGFGQPGNRAAVAFGTRGDLAQLTTLRTVDLLSYIGSADFALKQSLTISSRLDVPDTADVNGNGLCSNPQRCPMGSEDVPDWAGFEQLTLSPSRPLARRTEVVIPRVPSTLDTVVVAGLELDDVRGALPSGFASKTAGTPGADGTRPVDPVLLRTGVPFAGVEVSTPGVWTIALSTRSTAESARVFRSTGAMPTRLTVQPFLPLPGVGAYTPTSRAYTPQQPQWASLYSTGAELGRLSLTGSQGRHTVYFPVTLGQTAVQVPAAPAGPGVDPGAESAVDLEICGVDLSSGTGFDELFSLASENLSNWNRVIDGYSRIDRDR